MEKISEIPSGVSLTLLANTPAPVENVPISAIATSNSKVWRSSNNYLTIISEATSRPATGTDVAVFSVITGFVQAEVSNPNHTFYFNGVNWDLVQINTAMALGDSGSPMTNASGNQILGILKGADSSNTDFSPWDAVDSRFGGLNLH